MKGALSKFVARLESRSALSDAERDTLLAIDAERIEVRRRWDLVRPGEVVNHACLIEEGLAGRSEVFSDGRRSTTAIYVAGDMADLHSVVVSKAAWAITALTDCTYFAVPHEAIRKAFASHATLAFALWRDTIADASAMSKWISVLSQLPTKSRLAHFLCELSRRLAAVSPTSTAGMEIALTQEQFAELLGVTSTHVYRTFRELKAEGVIALERATVRIVDVHALERIANYDERYLLKQD